MVTLGLVGTPLSGDIAWTRLQHWCAHQCKRWSWGFLGVALGASGVYWIASDAVSAHEKAQQAVEAVLAQLHAQPTLSQKLVNPAEQVTGGLWGRLTRRRPQDIWIDLQQALGAQGVQVLSIRVLTDAETGPLSSQGAALRLNAPYLDWVNAWRALCVSGPVLSIERMSVVPQAQSHGVQMDVVLRRWFKPESEEVPMVSDGPDGWAAVVRSKVVSPSVADVFTLPVSATTPALLTNHVAESDSAALPADPQQWPLARIRVLGTWQQGSQWQAVLSVGGPWVPVRVGQRVSLEGHRVVAIQRDAVSLLSLQGQKLQLNWSGGSR
jgi:hypothetical protein